MSNTPLPSRQGRHPASIVAAILFDLLNPIAMGFFVGALIFDAVYANTAVVMWFKAAAWLITIGLLIAIIPRLINLVWVWFPGARPSSASDKAAFFLYLFGLVATIFNAFIHGRDAYAIIPTGLWLSILTVILLVAANILATVQYSASNQPANHRPPAMGR